MAREKLNSEINIVEIVKSWRYYQNALKNLLPENERINFKKRARYQLINPDIDENEAKR